MPTLKPTYGWLDIPNYRGWMPGDNFPERMHFTSPTPLAERLTLTGSTLTRSASPLSGVVIEFFQADLDGKYHLAEYRFRDRQKTDDKGRFKLETFVPGYVGTVRHISFIATARLPERRQPLFLSAAIFFATDEELSRRMSDADRPYVHPDATRYGDDPAYLRLSTLPEQEGVKLVNYDIVFDTE